MILVDRARVVPPQRLLQQAANATRELQQAYDRGEFRERRITFDRRIYIDFKPYLEDLFRGKCAFCESDLQAGGWGDVEHFRPKGQATSVDGKVDVDHYFWLAYDWNNLYLSCQLCNMSRGKSGSFPVIGNRSRLPAEETALLLDPCRDQPERHLVFRGDGRVEPRQLSEELLNRYAGLHPGEVTIRLFNLNRRALVTRRREKAEWVVAEVRLLLMTGPEKIRELLSDDTGEFVALQRDIIREQAKHLIREVGQPGTFERATVVVPVSIPCEPIGITRVQINNFRAIEHVDVEFQKPWKVFLGENATGKSSILQAIAFALMGEEYLARHNRNGRSHRLRALLCDWTWRL